jgi:hypothetical protein
MDNSTIARTAGQRPQILGKAQTMHLLLWVAGAFGALGTSAIIMIPFVRDAQHQVAGDEVPLLSALGLACAGVCVSSILAAVLLRAGSPHARTLALVAGIALIPFTPFGTAIGIGILITRASKDTIQYLAAMNVFRQSTV